MNVLVVNANRCSQPFRVMPFGACLVAEAASRAGHRVRFLDLTFHRKPLAALAEELRRFPPDVVGLSLRNIDNNEIFRPRTFYQDLPPLVALVRRLSSRTPVVIGGAAVGVMPGQLLRLSRADFAVTGDGESVFPALLDCLASGADPDRLPGVLHLAEGALVANPVACSRPLADCPAPDLPRWLDLGAYRASMACAPLQSRRGCPFDCIYCTYAAAEGRAHRTYDPDSVVRAARSLVGQGLTDVEFVDDVFNSPHDYALDLCRRLARARLNARFQTLELNPAFLTEELLDSMDLAGFVGVGVTAESASDPVLAGLRKSYSAGHVRRGARAIRPHHKLSCCWIFMIGGPGETPDTVEESIDFARSSLRPHDVAFFNTGIRIYPGTGLETLARSQGLLTASPDDMLSPAFYLSSALDPEWLSRRMRRAFKDNLNFVTNEATSLPMLQSVLFWGHKLGLRPPIWRCAVPIRRLLRPLGV